MAAESAVVSRAATIYLKLQSSVRKTSKSQHKLLLYSRIRGSHSMDDKDQVYKQLGTCVTVCILVNMDVLFNFLGIAGVMVLNGYGPIAKLHCESSKLKWIMVKCSRNSISLC